MQSTVSITVPTSAAEQDAMFTALDAHQFDHSTFEDCDTCTEYRVALRAYDDAQQAAHVENMDAIAHAEHVAYGECYQFEGDECGACDEYYALHA